MGVVMPVPFLLALILLNGYVTQRGSICAVAAAQEFVRLGRSHRYVGFLFCAACSLLTLAAAEFLGVRVIHLYRGVALSPVTVVGATIFGMGALVNGKCAFGTIARLGTGEAARIGTLLGFLAGAAIAFTGPMRTGHQPSLLLALDPGLRLGLAVAIATGLLLALTFVLRHERRFKAWPPMLSMSVIGTINGLLLMSGQRWPYTRLLLDLANGTATDLSIRSIMAVTFVGGAVAGALASGQFRPNIGTRHAWLRATLGGMGMGAGARLIPGGNDSMLLVGVPMLLPNLVLAYIVMSGVLLAAIGARSRLPKR